MIRRSILPILAALLIAALVAPGFTRAASAENSDADAGEQLFQQPASPSRGSALEKWADRAALPDLMYALRRPSSALGRLEVRLLERALKRVPAERTALSRRLILRLAVADSGHARRWIGMLAADAAPLTARASASVFRVAALLPDRGGYQGYARALRAGLESGLALESVHGSRPIELDFKGTGNGEPERAAAAFDSATAVAGTIVGELLSVPTLALAAAARVAGVPLISPTATDETIGATGPTTFQIGPSAWERGTALAQALLVRGRPARVGMLTTTELEGGGLAVGFAAVVESLGSQVVWRDTYTPGNLNFAAASQALIAKRVEVLFWDGDSREAEALLRRLSQDRVSLRVGGGEGLAPEQFHAEARALLEGVRFAADDWRLDPAAQAALDSVLRTVEGAEELSPSIVRRGYLAARFVAAAVRDGALCPEEVSQSLARCVPADGMLSRHRFLDCHTRGARISVMTVTRGRATPVQ